VIVLSALAEIRPERKKISLLEAQPRFLKGCLYVGIPRKEDSGQIFLGGRIAGFHQAVADRMWQVSGEHAGRCGFFR
jgi:hypothetical protein